MIINRKKKGEKALRFMKNKKNLIIVSILLVIVLICGVIGFIKLREPKGKVETGVSTINEITGSYIAVKDINGYYPMILINEDSMKINLTTTQYLVGKYKQTEDGLITFSLEENASNFENKEVSNLMFEDDGNKLIALKNVGSLILKDSVFEK